MMKTDAAVTEAAMSVPTMAAATATTMANASHHLRGPSLTLQPTPDASPPRWLSAEFAQWVPRLLVCARIASHVV